MSWASVVASRVRGLFGRHQLDRELDDEVRFHLELQIEDNIKAGMSPADARHAALRSFGGVEPMKEQYRERRALHAIEATLQDIRYAARTLRKNVGFTATAVCVLALAIGANTAMFSVLNAVLFRPLPYRSPEQLAMLWTELPDQNVREGRSAWANFEDWRRQSTTFADIAAYDPATATFTTPSTAEQIGVMRISPNFFSLLGVQPLHGRSFTAEDAAYRDRVAVISHRFWQTRFGGSLNAIGANVEIDGVSSRIIGILGADFGSAQFGNDVWQPHTMISDWERLRVARGTGPWFVIGRLQPRATLEQAQAEMDTIARRLDEQSPATERNPGISVMPLSLHVTGPRARVALWMLTGAVICVLLIAATNVASLSLARGVRREAEIAVRAALGASRGRIIRQLLAESLTLAAISGAAGLLIAWGGVRFVVSMQPVNLARLNEAGLDLRVAGWALGLCLITGILVGLAPAIASARRNLRPSEGRGIAGGLAARRIRSALVTAEFALAIVLLAGAGLLVRSLWSLENVDPGFKTERVFSAQLSTPAKTDAQRVDFYNSVVEQVRSLPGVESVGIIGDLFIGGNPERTVTVEQASSERLRLRVDEVSDRFFTTLAIPLLKGRFFSGADHADSPRVAIVNETMARRLWPGLDPVGKRFKFGPRDSNAPWVTVVGVSGDMRRQGLENEPIAQMFEPLAQNPSRLATLLVRTSFDDPLKIRGAVQAAVRGVDSQAPVYGVTTLENRLGGFLTERRFQTSILIGFSVVALLMAAIGIYGLIQYSVATRTNEIGVRMAIGARHGDIFRMILREGLKLSLIGVGLGIIGALGAGRAGASLLFGVTPTDPLTFVSVSLLLTIVAVAACYFPARRATRTDPLVALRHE